MTHFLITFLPVLAASAIGSWGMAFLSRAYYKASAWDEGYQTGVADTYTAIDANMPGYGPNRLNPYRDWRTGVPLTVKETWDNERSRRARRKSTKTLKRMERRASDHKAWESPSLPPLHGGYKPNPFTQRKPTTPPGPPPSGKGGGSHPRSDR